VTRIQGKRYAAVFDPLDGSSNVDAGIPTGTIFGIFDEVRHPSRATRSHVTRHRARAIPSPGVRRSLSRLTVALVPRVTPSPLRHVSTG
jgi:hypothetical protein